MCHATNKRNDILLLAEQLNHMVCSQDYEIVHRKLNMLFDWNQQEHSFTTNLNSSSPSHSNTHFHFLLLSLRRINLELKDEEIPKSSHKYLGSQQFF